MAKANSKSAGVPVATSDSDDHWRVRDAMRTMLRAGEIIKDKKLLTAVKKEALAHSKELQETATRAGQLAKMGLISPKAMAKLATR